MLVAELPEEAVKLAVVADRTELDSAALKVTQFLRDKGLAIESAYSGKPKKQAEAAKKRNVDGVLYVRDEKDGVPVLHLTQFRRDDGKRVSRALMTVLPDEWARISGDQP